MPDITVHVLMIWHNILTERSRSPRLNSPDKSAGPPARTNETKIPSLLSPPTMLNPKPDEPFFTITLLGSLLSQTQSKKYQIISILWSIDLVFCSPNK